MRGQVFDTHNLSQKKTIVLGREKPCDVLVTNSEVSKKHLTISFDDGKFVVSTMSQFGTGLFNEEATTVVAENDTAPISGSGLMKLGRSIVGFNSKVRGLGGEEGLATDACGPVEARQRI